MSEEVRVTSASGARKGTKPERYDLIPAEPLRLLAEHYGKGAEKYTERDTEGNVTHDGANNWRLGYDWGLSFAALMRHAWQFWAGEDIDPETGTPHPVAIMWHAATLTEFMETHPEFDNRPGKPIVDALGVDLETRKDLVERAKKAAGAVPGGAGNAGWPYGVTFYGSAGGSVG